MCQLFCITFGWGFASSSLIIPNSTSFLSFVAACLFLYVVSNVFIPPLVGESAVISIYSGLSGFYLFASIGIRGVPLNIPTYPSINIEFDNYWGGLGVVVVSGLLLSLRIEFAMTSVSLSLSLMDSTLTITASSSITRYFYLSSRPVYWQMNIMSIFTV
jgi:hypothetical protein